MKTEIGVIRVLTTDDEEILSAHGRLLESRFPELRVVSRCIEDQPNGIYNEETRAIAVPKVVELGKEMEKQSLRAVIVSCADDPGVEELRKLVRIPVIGAGSACAGLALSCGTRIGTLGIRGSAPKAMKAVLGEHLVAEAKPDGVTTTLDLLTDEGKRNAIQAVNRLTEASAEVIALACTGYATIGIARELRKTFGFPVFDPVESAGLITWHLISP
jgi:Asp/Glu/hydantoin racemase